MSKSLRAFSYLEGLLVIIIVSILVGLNYPRIGEGRLSLAANDLVAHLKYIGYLATLTDNYAIDDRKYHAKLWQIRFSKRIDRQSVIAYSIFRDKNGNDKPDKGEFLKDALTQNDANAFAKGLSKNTNTFLNELYGVSGIEFSSNCSKRGSRKLYFDRFGQVYINHEDVKVGKLPLVKATDKTCKITLKQKLKTVDVCIETATAYAYRCDSMQEMKKD